jgi:hypothetical protein
MQKKRHKNFKIYKELCSGVSLRQTARVTCTNKNTVAKKLLFLKEILKLKFEQKNSENEKALKVQFDDLETFEHTKCKPISITLAVEKHTRRILGFEVASMPAKGLLAKKAFKKYGPRLDERRAKRRILLEKIKPLIFEHAEIESDSNPHYAFDVAEFFPNARYKQYLSRRGAITGQGELKKQTFDPLWSLNHTCAMFRAHVSRLIRKTWNTTKRKDCLEAHLYIYSYYHNLRIAQLVA